MGSELMGQLIMAQLVDGIIVSPEWVEQCRPDASWTIKSRSELATKQCEDRVL